MEQGESGAGVVAGEVERASLWACRDERGGGTSGGESELAAELPARIEPVSGKQG
jgi:hypothetical protein